MRIRTVKPEFWTHPIMGRQKPEVQLLALGLLNLADDAGYFLADAGLVRAALCPFSDRSVIVHGSITTLEKIGWIEVRNHQTHGPIGKVINFEKHQVINRPKESKLLEYFVNSPITDESRIDHGSITDRSLLEGKGMEQGMEQGMEGNREALRASWNDLGEPFPKWKAGRKDLANAALKRRCLEEWVQVFEKVKHSPFCRGENSHSWVADIDWVLRAEGKKPETALKLLEGSFDARPTSGGVAGISKENIWKPGMAEFSGDM